MLSLRISVNLASDDLKVCSKLLISVQRILQCIFSVMLEPSSRVCDVATGLSCSVSHDTRASLFNCWATLRSWEREINSCNKIKRITRALYSACRVFFN